MLRLGRKSLSVQSPHEPGSISVANGAEFTNVKAGDVAGRKSQGDSKPTSEGENIDVMRNAKVSGSELGDIAGVIQTEKPKSQQKH